MQFNILTSLLLASLAAVGVATPDLSPRAPKTPSLTFLYSLNCTLGTALSVGAVPHGTRVVIPITGGTFTGPRLSGKVLNLGADWGLVDTNGTFSADTRYHLQTSDGANIFIRTSGPAQADGKLHLRIIFEAATAGKYGWLNNIVAVGVLTSGAGFVSIDAWALST